MTTSASNELLNILSSRHQILDLLVDESADKRTLTDELPISRSTVNRGLSELEKVDLVEETQMEYEATQFGRLAYQQYGKFISSMNGLSTAKEVLSYLPKNSVFDPVVLANAEIITPIRTNPDRPLNRIEDVLCKSSLVKGFLPTIRYRSFKFIENQIQNGLRFELLVESVFLTHLTNSEPKWVQETVSTSNFTLFEVGDEFLFGLLIVDDPHSVVFVIVFNPNGAIQGLIENKGRYGFSWAERVFDTFQSKATRVTV